MECPICYEEVNVMFKCKRCNKESVCEKCYLQKMLIDKTETIACPLCRFDDDNGTFSRKVLSNPQIQVMNNPPQINNYIENEEKNDDKFDIILCIMASIALMPVIPACEPDPDLELSERCKHKAVIYCCVMGTIINCCVCSIMNSNSVFNCFPCLTSGVCECFY